MGRGSGEGGKGEWGHEERVGYLQHTYTHVTPNNGTDA